MLKFYDIFHAYDCHKTNTETRNMLCDEIIDDFSLLSLFLLLFFAWYGTNRTVYIYHEKYI